MPLAKTSATAIRNTQRRVEMLNLRLQGLTLEQVGERMGVTAATVQRIVSAALASVATEPAQELLALELGRCDVLLAEAMQTVKAFHPMVSGGRVVSAPMLDSNGEPIRNPETGEVLTRVLEDKAPRLAGIAAALRVMERRAKLLGLDAAIAVQQEVHVLNEDKKPKLENLTVEDLEQIKAKLYPGQELVPVSAGEGTK